MNLEINFALLSTKAQRLQAFEHVMRLMGVQPAPNSMLSTRFDFLSFQYVYARDCIPAGAGHHWHGTNLN